MKRLRRSGARVLLVVALVLPACDHEIVETDPPGAPCPRTDDFLHTIAVARPAASVQGVAVSSDILYAAAGADGVHLYRMNPGDAAPLATLAIADARAVDVEGTVLYVAAGDGGLVLVDVSDPVSPAITGSVAFPGCAVDVDATAARAYVANDDIGLAVVDVSNPAAPAVRGIENSPGRAVGVAARDALAFLADEENGLRIVNATDPTAPYVVRTVPVPGAAKGVAIGGNTVAVAAREGDLVLVDVSVPAFASIVGTYPLARDVISVAVSGHVAFAAVGSGGIEAVDVSAPASPRGLQRIGTANVVRDVAVRGNRLAIAEEASGARSMAIDTPLSPAVDAHFAGGDIRSVQAFGGLLVVGDASFGVRVFDPAAQVVVGEVAVSGGVRDFALADSLLYGINDGAVPVVDLHDPSQPALLAPVPAGGAFDDIGVAGEFIYLLSSVGTLIERRIDNTGLPRSLTFNGPYLPSLTIQDPYIYLPDRQGNVYIVLRQSMRLASVVPVGASAERVVFQSEDGPFGPVVRGWVAESGLGNGRAALEVYDFANIIFPELTATVPCAGNAVGVAMSGEAVVVAEGEDGWEAYLSDGNAIPPAGYFPEAAYDVVAVDGHYRFAVAAGAAGLQVINLGACFHAR